MNHSSRVAVPGFEPGQSDLMVFDIYLTAQKSFLILFLSFPDHRAPRNSGFQERVMLQGSRIIVCTPLNCHLAFSF